MKIENFFDQLFESYSDENKKILLLVSTKIKIEDIEDLNIKSNNFILKLKNGKTIRKKNFHHPILNLIEISEKTYIIDKKNLKRFYKGNSDFLNETNVDNINFSKLNTNLDIDLLEYT